MIGSIGRDVVLCSSLYAVTGLKLTLSAIMIGDEVSGFDICVLVESLFVPVILGLL